MQSSDDYILRMVRQIADMLGRIAGLRSQKKFSEAENEIDAALKVAVGPLAREFSKMSAGSIALILGPTKCGLVANILRERAALRSDQGNLDGARVWNARADELEKASGAES